MPDLLDFEKLYAEHAPAVFRFSWSLSGNRTLAEDITSETFIRVWTARERVDLATVTGYLITIARHLYLEHVRRDRGREELDGSRRDGSPGPDALAEARDELETVLEDLQTLPEPDRAALLMRAHDRLSYKEIAASLSITPGAAKVKVHRARARIAALRLNRKGQTI